VIYQLTPFRQTRCDEKVRIKIVKTGYWPLMCLDNNHNSFPVKNGTPPSNIPIKNFADHLDKLKMRIIYLLKDHRSVDLLKSSKSG
jgi:hypothetical protein